jgi:transcriptional regulator with GAF, ATPase, and Fis domain/predicted negative regulator of RcsB-dependent stress response
VLRDLDPPIQAARRAKDSGDPSGARARLARAVAEAVANGADAEDLRAELALVHFELSEMDAARRCLAACRPATRERHPVALLARGGLLRSEGRTSEAAAVYETAQSAARASGDTLHALIAASMSGQILTQEGDTAGAVEQLRAVLAEATTPELARARLLALLGIANALVRHGVHEDAMESARQALKLALELDNPRYQGVALRMISASHSQRGEVQAAFDAAQRAVEAATLSGDPLLVAQTSHRRAEVLVNLGRTQEAVAEFERCVAFCRSHGENFVLCIALGGLGEGLLAIGAFAAAEKYADDALAVSKTIGSRYAEANSYDLIGRIAEAKGDLAGALAAQRERFRVDAEIRSEQSERRLDRVRAEIEAERRQAEEARAGERALRDALAEVKILKERLSVENQYLREELVAVGGFDEIVGKSAPLRNVLHQVARVAPTDASVLILGETGVGKELVARAIHARSSRKDCALLTVNCATLPATLIESELFGHEKGAFTGALARKIGRFELADGGTIFLDEIGELPLDLQSKLLRVLQEGEFERLGESVTRRTDVRIVAATNRDLLAASRAGGFRADLYYRLAVFTIDVPPLRERRDDVPLLVAYFVACHGDRLKKRIARIPDDTMRALVAYDWPGNIRELSSVVQRAVILSPGDALLLDGSFALPTTPPAPAPAPSSNAFAGSLAAPAADEPADQSLDGAERTHILRVLAACGWKVKGPGNAAHRLGVPPSTLRSRMSKLGIERGPRA